MPIQADTFVTRIDLTEANLDVAAAIEGICARQASRDNARRLAAAFECQNQVILIFQSAENRAA